MSEPDAVNEEVSEVNDLKFLVGELTLHKRRLELETKGQASYIAQVVESYNTLSNELVETQQELEILKAVVEKSKAASKVKK